MKNTLVAKDFGTSGTIYAYAFHDSKKNIKVGKYNTKDDKFPTEIILKDKYEIKKFGKECKRYKLTKEFQKENNYYFADIKMKLYENKNEITSINGNLTLNIVLKF